MKKDTLTIKVQYVPHFKETRLFLREENSGKNWIWETIIVKNEDDDLESAFKELRNKAFVKAGEYINSGKYKEVKINPFSD